MKRKRPHIEPEQMGLFRTWGGARKGAGRPTKRDAGASHKKRAHLAPRHPVHVTLRAKRGVCLLRAELPLRALRGAFRAARAPLGLRLVHYSVQDTHLHMIVEAESTRALSRGMQGLTIRMAKALNRVLSRRGSVFAERFHAHPLRTPREVFHALRYVL